MIELYPKTRPSVASVHAIKSVVADLAMFAFCARLLAGELGYIRPIIYGWFWGTLVVVWFGLSLADWIRKYQNS